MATVTSEQDQTVTIKQHCDHCRKAYVHAVTVEASASSICFAREFSFLSQESARDNAYRRLQRKVARVESSYGARSYGVLCPHCGRFVTKAMKCHFPDGFRAGLLTKAKQEMVRGSVWVGVVGAALTLPAFLVPMVLLKSGLLGILVALLPVAGTTAYWFTAPRARFVTLSKMLDRMTEDELLHVVVEAYKKGRGPGEEETLDIPVPRELIAEYLATRDRSPSAGQAQ